MKAGLENKRQLIILAVLGVLALFMLSRSFIGNSASQPGTANNVATTATTKRVTPARSRGRANVKLYRPGTVDPLDPTLHLGWLKEAEGKEYEGGNRNIFSENSEPPVKPQPDAGVKTAGNTPPQPPQPTGPPPAPPINLKFYGFASKPGEKKKIFLSSGEDIFVASEGDIVKRQYRIGKITNNSVEIEDVLNNNRQTIPLSST